MANTNIKAPNLNISNIKSPLSGGGFSLGRVGQGGTSKLGTLASIVRKNKISINSLKLEKEESINSSLMETNRILIEIQKQLALDFSMRVLEEKEKRDKLQKEESKNKLKSEESALEKTGKKIGKAVGKVASKILAPVKSIFDKVLDFLLTLGAGVAVNAIFEWLKDEDNIEKVKGWFSWIKENWKWMAAAVGAIALLPVVGAISGLLGPVATIVGLLAKAVPLLVGLFVNPLFLKAMLAIGAGVLLYKGGEFLLKKALKKARNLVTGGEDFSAAHSQLDQQLADAGMGKDGRTTDLSNRDKRKGKTGRNEEQEKIFQEVKKKRKALYALKDQMNAEIKEKQSNLEIIPTPSGSRRRKMGPNPNEIERKKVDMEVRENYREKVQNIVPITPTKIEARRMGGPVTAGRPYLVGESGPELFAPNINGSVINNMKTEKIYQMISSDMGEGGINMIELPPITNQLPPPEISVPSGPATEVPEVSSVNLADPYRQLTPMLYGITV